MLSSSRQYKDPKWVSIGSSGLESKKYDPTRKYLAADVKKYQANQKAGRDHFLAHKEEYLYGPVLDLKTSIVNCKLRISWEPPERCCDH